MDNKLSFNEKRVWGPTPRYPNILKAASDPLQKDLIVIAGPCSIEDEAQIVNMSAFLRGYGVTFMRGGVYRAGTYPPAAQGLRKGLLKLWADFAHSRGLKIIVEVLDLRQIDYLDQYADAFQVGARHMQDYALLRELSRTRKVVTVKRAPGATLDEFLGAAEYLTRGPARPILIERGSATHMNHVRWDLSVSTVAALKAMTKIPVLVDASHGTGRRDLVVPLTLAGLAAGADGFLVEVHPKPSRSLSDADQAISKEDYATLLRKADYVRAALKA